MLELTEQNRPATVEQAREVFRAWMREHEEDLRDFRQIPAELERAFSTLRRLQRLLFDAGWMRLGWPPEVGGLGGPLAFRAVVSEELAEAGYPPPFSFGTQEVLGPAVASYAPTELAATFMPRLLSGDETWCQGFSEPDAGSDLGSLRCRAVDDGDAWVVTGEKVWTSWAQFADRCLLLTRTGEPDSGHRGITALFVDMDAVGLELSPLVSMAGDEEFCSLHFDGVRVPKSRTIGDVGSGWGVAMTILANERGAAAWQRQAWLRTRLEDLLSAPSTPSDEQIGESYELLQALRLLSRRTVRSLSAGYAVGALASFDKLLLSTSEKYLFDIALEAMPGELAFGTGPEAESWRSDYLYSRASSIYGGTAEIQRNIIAERVLGLPRS